MRTDDWEVNSEGDLQRAIHEWLAHRFPAYLILKGGDLDFTLVAPPPRTPAVCFIECKAYTGQRPGGMGFGNQLGQGAQVELLLEPWLSMPMVRWCFADLTRPAGDARYALLTSGRARRCARGEVSRGKQNNFRIKDALRQPLKRAVLLDRIEPVRERGSTHRDD